MIENDTGITPIRSLILIRHLPEETTDGGLHLPQGVKLKNRALVLAVGSGHITQDGGIVPLEVKPGDFVIINAEGVAVVERDRVKGDIVMVREADVLAIDRRNDGLRATQ